MCWYTYKKSSYKSPHVAEEDIKVYKVLMKTSESSKRYISPVMNAFYSIGELCTSPLVPTEVGELLKIERGLHSYSGDCNFKLIRYKDADKLCINGGYLTGYTVRIKDVSYTQTENILTECIIPKGGTYYENETGEIVSDKLMVTKEVDLSELECIDRMDVSFYKGTEEDSSNG